MEQILAEIFNNVPWKPLMSLAFAAIVFAIAKRYYDNISAYWMFRSNKDLGKNVRIMVNGQEGIIEQMSWRFIYIKLKESGNQLIIPMTRWTTFTWEIYKNGKEVK